MTRKPEIIDYISLVASKKGRESIEHGRVGGESRLSRAKTIISSWNEFRGAYDDIHNHFFLKAGIRDGVESSGRELNIIDEDDIHFDKITSIPSHELKEMDHARINLLGFQRKLAQVPGLDFYLQAVVAYGAEAGTKGVSHHDARQKFAAKVGEIFGSYRRLRAIHQEQNIDLKLATEYTAKLMTPYVFASELGDAHDFAEWAEMYEFQGRKADSFKLKTVSKNVKVLDTKTESTKSIPPSINEKKNELLASVFRRVAGSNELEDLNPSFEDKSEAIEAADQWWKAKAKAHEKTHPTDGAKELYCWNGEMERDIVEHVNGLIAQKEGWTLQDVWNITEVITNFSSRRKNGYNMSSGNVTIALANLAESLALGSVATTDEESKNALELATAVVLSRLKGRNNDYHHYDQWDKTPSSKTK